MNIVIAKIGFDITLGFISGLATMTNSLYSLMDRLTKSGNIDIKRTIESTDMELSIKVLQCMISEIDLDQYTDEQLDAFLITIHETNEIVDANGPVLRLHLTSNSAFEQTVFLDREPMPLFHAIEAELSRAFDDFNENGFLTFPNGNLYL